MQTEPKIVRRPLPSLYISLEEFETLEDMATARGVSVADLLKAILAEYLEPEKGKRLVVLHIPDWTYHTFVRFFEGDEELAKSSMVGHLDAGAGDFAVSLKAVENDR